MKKLLQFSGLLTWLAAIIYGFSYLIEYKPNVITIIYTVLSIVGVIAIIVLIIRLLYGKSWFFNLGKEVIVGNDLIKATESFLGELPLPKKEATANFVGHLVYRFTRLGFIGLALAMIPIWLLYQQNTLLLQQNERIDSQNNLIESQNSLFTEQNKRLEQQTYLQEAERRGSLVFLFSNVMDAIDKELKDDIGKKGVRDLSSQLIGRIIALSRRLKPYRYLENDSLITSPLSAERGQLLVSLVESHLNNNSYLRIFQKSDFTFSDLEGVSLNESKLMKVNLRGANLKDVKLMKADLRGANLRDAKLMKADLQEANLKGAKLMKADLRGANLKSANFAEANLRAANVTFDYEDKWHQEDLIFFHSNFDHSSMRDYYMIHKFVKTPFKYPLKGLAFTNLQKSNLTHSKIEGLRVSSDFFQRIQKFGSDSIIGTKYINDNFYMDSILIGEVFFDDTIHTYFIEKRRIQK